jgi:SAM-dependent methyltransferase
VTQQKQPERTIRTVDDLLRLMDGLFTPEADRWTSDGAAWWDRFYADHEKPVPFFVAKPDENLVSYLDRGLIGEGRALDLGCGPGRNALYLASRGFTVDAVDLSPGAIDWALDRAAQAKADIRFHCGDAFDFVHPALAGTPLAAGDPSEPEPADGMPADAVPAGRYDLIYDSGCFHHLPPHRRISYLALLAKFLAPGGHFAITCFVAEEGAGQSDAELYRDARLHGGLGYTPASLRSIFADLTELELRRMRAEPAESDHFGVDFLWTALFRRDTATPRRGSECPC